MNNTRPLTISLSVFSGALIAVMLMVNGVLAGNLGNYTSTVLIHVVGLVTIVAVLAVTRSRIKIPKGIPIYLFSAGVIGVFTVLFNNIGFIALGASLTIALGLLGQTLASILIDHFGWFGLPKMKFVKKKYFGLALIAMGIIVMILL